MGVLLIAFSVINWIIYHKMFHVIYFNGLKSMTGEIFWCIFIGVIETGIVVYAGAWLLGILGTLLVWLLIIAGVCLAVYAIYRIYKSVKK